jgi:hypothetical protein
MGGGGGGFGGAIVFPKIKVEGIQILQYVYKNWANFWEKFRKEKTNRHVYYKY